MIFILAIFTVVPLVLTVLNYCEYINYHTRITFRHYLPPTLQNSKKNKHHETNHSANNGIRYYNSAIPYQPILDF